MLDELIEKLKKLGLFKQVVIAAAAIWIVYLIAIAGFFEDWQESGVFGDSFGGLNALFTGLAFGVLVYTMLLQKQELKLQREELALQREELRLTRDEISRSADAQEQSRIALGKQVEISKHSALLSAAITGAQGFPRGDTRSQLAKLMKFEMKSIVDSLDKSENQETLKGLVEKLKG
jgi:hypothetical protein